MPDGFHLVFPCHPFTHIPPKLINGIVPSPSPNLTPERTSGIDPLTVTSLSIRCLRARGKSSGVRSVVQEVFETAGSVGSHCALSYHIVKMSFQVQKWTYNSFPDGLCLGSGLVMIIFALQIPIRSLIISFV